MRPSTSDPRLDALATILDQQTGRYEAMRGVRTFDAYLATTAAGADEETLTEPVLGLLIERVLGFPTGEYVPQIRRYMAQRSLDYGVLFNLRELRVYLRGVKGYEADVSFAVRPLWQFARGEALPGPEYGAFTRFCELFAYRQMDVVTKIEDIRQQLPWSVRLATGEPVEVDVEFLVDQLRRLSRTLADDAAAQISELSKWLALNPAREAKLRDELRLLALDLAPGLKLEDLPAKPLEWRDTAGVAERAWRQYLLRVGYLALTRILLYRAWEDVEFVRSYLYDGGFDRAYVELSENVAQVLREAFLHGADRYRWLFGGDNNYDWYRPREAALVEVLYLLAPVPLGKLDADVLGELYVSYVDEIDRDRLGQFFTPRSVVRFMLDRAGFSGHDVFRVEGDERKPRRLLDFATGSGGFLVEAARRVIEEAGDGEEETRPLYEALTAIARGLVGGEISPFPYYLTEVNLLLQVSRLQRNWWEAAWPRRTEDLLKPKVISLYRTDRGRFALDEAGGWQPSIKTTVVVARTGDGPVAYLCGLLNSELLDLWYAVRGKTPWHVRRNYEPKRMNEIPYRRPEGDGRAERVEQLVRLVAQNRQALLPQRPFVRDLARIVKDPWKDGPVVVDDAALVAALPPAETVSVRLDPLLDFAGKPSGRGLREASGVLVFRRGAAETGRVQGESARLDLLETLLRGRPADDVESLLLPKELAAYARRKEEIVEAVRNLLVEGRRLVEEIERLVCGLYDVPPALTDAVVDHAVARAGSSQPDAS